MVCACLDRYPHRLQLCELSADGGFSSCKHFGYLDLCVYCLFQGVNLVSFFSGEVCLVHLCNLDLPAKGYGCYRIPPAQPALLKIALDS